MLKQKKYLKHAEMRPFHNLFLKHCLKSTVEFINSSKLNKYT